MRYGFWTPVFGGWLRAVEDEAMDASWASVRDTVLEAERLGYDLTLIAELYLNDIKGPEAPVLDAWSLAAALAAVTERLELMVAVRPTFHHPGPFAKQAATIDAVASGRLTLNVVSSWWEDEAKQFGFQFDRHADRYARTQDWIAALDKLWSGERVDHAGTHYVLDAAVSQPRPLARPRPRLYAGGESEDAKNTIARHCDSYVMHGDPPELIRARIEDMETRRRGFGLPPMTYGMAAYAIVRDTEQAALEERARVTAIDPAAAPFANFDQWINGTELERALLLEEYAVSNRGLRPNLVGTPAQIRDRLADYEDAGLDLVLLQMSPQREEMRRFAEAIIAPARTELGA